MPVDLFPGVPPEVQEMFARMGLCLSLIQSAEKTLAGCFATVFHDAPVMSEQSIAAEEEGVQKKTLGQLLAKLRERVYIEPAFDASLRSFHDNRNTFVHGSTTRPEFGLDDSEGRKRLCALIDQIIRQSLSVVQVLTAVTIEFADALGKTLNETFVEPKTPEERVLIGEFRSMIPGLAGTFVRQR